MSTAHDSIGHRRPSRERERAALRASSDETAHPSHQKHLTAQDHAALSKAADLHTIAQITQIWSDRLQLISVYASFFTSIDSLLFSLASSKDDGSPSSKLTLAALVGSLIFHAGAAILAYVASFVLIRYKLNDAQSSTDGMPPQRSEPTAASHARSPSAMESGHSTSHEKPEHTHKSHSHSFSFPSSPFTPFFSATSGRPSLLTAPTTVLASLLHQPPALNIDMRRVSFFDLDAMAYADAERNATSLMRLLNKCHNVCSAFALAGFLLVVTGIVAYIWAILERSVAIFGSACVGVCIIMGFAALH
ncbi:hypothetical protein BC834DRAFT_885872 [Gloeopeniophorella convolvens]|nr:hypothetical protein BC834DRAFT_885872 [Gloeopeniophorella convolvens]